MADADSAAWELDRRDPSPENQRKRSIFSVPVTVSVSVGRTQLSVSEVLELQPEAVVPLNARIEDPVDLSVDNKVIAKGELVETDGGGLAVKIVEIMEQSHDDLR